MIIRLLLCLLLFLPLPSISQAKSPLWRVDCDNKDSYWFLMDERKGAAMPIFIGNSITVIPYPGLGDIKDIYNDPRIEWLSKDKISVLNNDKDAGWKGHMIFHRCKKL